MPVWVDSLDQLQAGKIIDHSFSARLAWHSCIRSGLGVHPGARIHYGNLRETMPPTYLKVSEIMTWSNFDRTRAKFFIHRRISDDGNLAAHQRQSDSAADQVLIARIIRIDGDAAVTKHRFGPGSSNDDMSGTVDEWIADVPQIACGLL